MEKLAEHIKISFNFEIFLQNGDVAPSFHGLYVGSVPNVASFHQLSVESHDHIHFIKSD
jgi:hypothetical protein